MDWGTLCSGFQGPHAPPPPSLCTRKLHANSAAPFVNRRLRRRLRHSGVLTGVFWGTNLGTHTGVPTLPYRCTPCKPHAPPALRAHCPALARCARPAAVPHAAVVQAVGCCMSHAAGCMLLHVACCMSCCHKCGVLHAACRIVRVASCTLRSHGGRRMLRAAVAWVHRSSRMAEVAGRILHLLWLHASRACCMLHGSCVA